ncbi:MAG TPA: peptidase [Candidatus Alectryocaccobium stercorigallinarum]|nr:peptidase [Candidatus Alectryocaccobium stercorigallinarum]
MASKIKKILAHIFSNRTGILLVIFACFCFVLVARVFQLQIVSGDEYAENFDVMTTRTRRINSTRGNIYDVNGNLIAYNDLSNNITLEDNGTYASTREKNLSLNGEIYRLIKLIESCGDTVDDNFHIDIDENGNYVFDVDAGTQRDRFRADIFGESYIEDMTEEQATATPDEIISVLCSAERFALVNEENPYTEEELSSHGLPSSLTKDEVLKIVRIRYRLSLTSYQKYMQVTVASNVSDATVAAVMENADSLQGVAVEEDSIRVYNYAESMSSIIGYTGSISAEELEELSAERSDYNNNSVVGKTGIEQYMETTLQGTDGYETVAVDTMGKVLKIYEDSVVEPQQGDDVYLTIDAELQEACYNILEQRIAGILVSNIVNVKTLDDLDEARRNSGVIYIPIYDVYNALISNSVIDIGHFVEEDATVLEKSVYSRYTQRFAEVSSQIANEISGASVTRYSQLSEEMQEYLSYIIDDLLISSLEIIAPDGNYENDEMYTAWEDGSVSVYDFLHYAVSNNWIDLSQLYEDSLYADTSDVLNVLRDYVINYISSDTDFSKLIYKYMLLNDIISPDEICQLLYDQNVLSKEDENYLQFSSGQMSARELIINKISNLEITPAQLALDPCSGSIVVTDPDTGDVRALVSYPGYDNNRLANTMDTDYYWKLYEDDSTPFYNKATQQLTAPGSTFKPVMAAAGLSEGVVDTSTVINCNGLFGEGLVESGDQLHCWLLTGHGDQTIVDAIRNSCNVFFATIGFELGSGENGEYSSQLALAKIQDYASKFNLDEPTNIQITESNPRVSDDMPIPSSIGQGTHQYTTTQLARYAGTIYSDGVSYDLNLLDKVTDASGNTLKEFDAHVSNDSGIDGYIWDIIQEGMKQVVESRPLFDDLDIELHGKTGTAQENETRPDHALFIGFTENTQDDISFAVRIANGYSSDNAAVVAKDVLKYYYELESEEDIITGESETDGLTSVVTD